MYKEDHRRMVIIFEIEDDDGDEVEIELPAIYAVCNCCEGRGHVDHPAFSGGFTASEWADEDDDFREDYLNGRYDVTCSECNGRNVVLVPDEKQCHEEDLSNFYDMLDEEARYQRIVESERRYGC